MQKITLLTKEQSQTSTGNSFCTVSYDATASSRLTNHDFSLELSLPIASLDHDDQRVENYQDFCAGRAKVFIDYYDNEQLDSSS